MNVVLLTGPHGSGKSTIGRAVMARQPAGAVRAIFADDGGAWKKAPAVIQAMFTAALAGPEAVLFVEGTHRITLAVIRAYLKPEALAAHVLSVTPAVMRTLLERRCVAKGKVFEAAYWSDHRCHVDNEYYKKLGARLPVRPRYHQMDAAYAAGAAVVDAVCADIAKGL